MYVLSYHNHYSLFIYISTAVSPDAGKGACVLIADFSVDNTGKWVPRYHCIDLSTTVKDNVHGIRCLTKDGLLVNYRTGQDKDERRWNFSYLLVNKTAETFKMFRSQSAIQHLRTSYAYFSYNLSVTQKTQKSQYL